MIEKINIYENARINELFLRKNWNIDESNKFSLYNRYLKTYSLLNSDERELFSKLSQSFEIVSIEKYQICLISLMEQIISKHFKTKQIIYIYPIKTSHDSELIKSSDLISYLCKSTAIKYIDSICKKKLYVLGSYSQVKKKVNQLEKHSLLILDDFIGSGNYATTVAGEITSNGISKEHLIIGALYACRNGYNKLIEESYIVECQNIVDSCLPKLSSKEKEYYTYLLYQLFYI
ncbi:hypothetical protein SDC9_135368 [bioreactor metagenome]|uniref:Phosphoribosyltransferase domain-containing protein n=1 Tax=bioreactor metagenome TaxID=1076179 RepID=A0A645DFZ8_9ZZZZ